MTMSRDAEVDKQLQPLMDEFEKLQALTADAHPGLFTWNDFVRLRLLRIKAEAAKLTGLPEKAKP